MRVGREHEDSGIQRGRRGRGHARRRLALAALVATAALLVLPAAAGAATSPTPALISASPVPTPIAAGPPAGAGALIFSQNCSGCHGPTGGGAFGPPLSAAGFPSLVAAMVRQGGIQMPALPNGLKPSEVDAVSVYVAEHIADPISHTARQSEGGDLYRLYCGGCHSATGRGGAMTVGRNAPDIAQYPAAEALAAMFLGRGNMPVFAGSALDTRQQTSVALYVEALVKPASPGGHAIGLKGPVVEGMVAGVALLALILAGVWLSWGSGRERVD